jgi:broad specificity phosphatase PhoE
VRQTRTWPDALLLIRHGESRGNVARDRAEAEGLPMIEVHQRDMDVELSDRGVDQARALGRWFASPAATPDDRPTAVVSSPYERARETAALMIESAGLDVELTVDERLREREFGVLDRLTKAGIKERFPEQAELRTFLGKFYHRPPGGESWADVALRVRSILDELSVHYEGERVAVVAHQVVILMFRYVIERLSEAEVLTIDREHELANCSITSFLLDHSATPPRPRLDRFNFVGGVADEGSEVTWSK